MKKTGIKLLMLTYLLFTFISAINVKAEEILTGKIGLTYQYEDEFFDNRSISLYHVATQDEDGNFIYADDFKGNQKIENLTTSEWSSLALKLGEQVEKNSISSYDVKITDNNGKVTFENIPLGLYLVKIEKVTKGDYEYLSSPMLITLPNFDEIANDYITEIEIVTKTEKRKIEKTIPQKTSSNPYTNDTIMIYVIGFVISALAMLFLLYYVLRQKKQTSHVNKEEDRKEKERNEDEQANDKI